MLSMPTTTLQFVIYHDDDSDCPMVGLVIGWEDEDRVSIAWGDEKYRDHPRTRIESMDELMPYRRR